ncbi:MAG: DNA gyrase subunit A [Flavobacterium sp.]
MSADDILAEKYQMKSGIEHILSLPDTYIGSVEEVDSDQWIMDGDMAVEKKIKYIPGLFKLFDEGIVNCRDHVVRMLQAKEPFAMQVTNIEVTIEPDGTIVMCNDGKGIDVAQHPEHNIWIPEMIFAHLRTSSNYNTNEKRIVGGKNGFGVKLVFIWSTYGSIETVDQERGLKYTQVFRNNLDDIEQPTITKCKSKPYTKITFKPDYVRLGVPGLSPDMIALFKRRVYDVGAVTDKNIKVRYNGELIPVKNFEQYINLYIGDKSTAPRVYESDGERWEYAVALSPSYAFAQVSFVNGIHTAKGGKHIEYVMGQIVRKLSDYIEKKKKVKVLPSAIKEQLILFLRCDIENPAFDSQTKDCMNTPVAKFGSKCEVSDKFIEKVAKMGVMDAALRLTEVKDTKAAKKTDGKKSRTVNGIIKLVDANWAGTDKSKDCMLILCEGDSAKAGVLSGLSSEDRNTIGVYPLKGKLLNVRGEPVKKIGDNKEIAELKQILGLASGRDYHAIEEVHQHLRYSKVLFITDQDLDGSHIKGLGINLFLCEWPSLARIPGFICFMNTPILKAKKGKNQLHFYNDGEIASWKESTDIKGWDIKYYKGLGTSTGAEFKEYFQHKKIVHFQYTEKVSDDAIDMVFNKKRADDRKDWLKVYDRDAYLDTGRSDVTYEEFIHRELIHFSKYDCDRNIPNLMDGFKISQRKIMYAAFKRKLTSEVKVAQFSGYVSEHSSYHHGEASLNEAIVGIAQNFVGSNNINLLMPNGQFGTRLLGGNDHASTRYIFTMLNPLTRSIFPVEDDAVLDYLEDDGNLVEPIYYAPVIPMILVNGTTGIGTGFSTNIMCYNPLQLVTYLEDKLRGVTSDSEFIPYYEGFKGAIYRLESGKFLIKGCYEKIGPDTIRVTELPVGYWTEDFKQLLENLRNPKEDKKEKEKEKEKKEQSKKDKDGATQDKESKKKSKKDKEDATEDVDKKEEKEKVQPIVKDFVELWTDSSVLCEITFVKGKLDELENTQADHGCNGVEKLLKLYTTNTTTNMHLFDANDLLQKYDHVSDIIDAYYDVRLTMYQTRKDNLIDRLERESQMLANKARYIQENVNQTIDLRNKPKSQVVEMLQQKGYDMLEDDANYAYLVKMSMDSVTKENVEKLIQDRDHKQAELDRVKSTTPSEMWLRELAVFKDEYLCYKEQRNEAQTETIKETKNSSVAPKKKVVKKQTIVQKGNV